MEKLALVAVGGAVGASLRYALGAPVVRTLGAYAPFGPATGTFVINVVGSLMMGLLVGWLALRGEADQERWRLLIGVGLLGGFTTFSAYSLEIIQMLQRRELSLAAAYALGSMLLGVAGLYVGLLLARRMFL